MAMIRVSREFEEMLGRIKKDLERQRNSKVSFSEASAFLAMKMKKKRDNILEPFEFF